MSHNLDIVNGQASMFSVGETPWHRLGKVVNTAPTAAEAIELAGLNWQVNIEPAYTWDAKAIEGSKITRRSTDGKVLGIVGDRYRPLQNVEAFKFFDAFVEAGEASYETAGALHGGSRVWILAKLNRNPLTVGAQDKINKYVLLSNGHDGKLSCRVGFTGTRVVCQNTLNMAHSAKASKLIRIRHNSKIVQNLDNIRTTMNMIDAEFEATGEMYNRMANTGINKNDLETYVKKILGKDDGTDGGKRAIARVMQLAATGLGSDLDSASGTVYGAYQAVNEYLNHYQGRTEENRLDNLVYGQAQNVDSKALNLAYNYATVGGF